MTSESLVCLGIVLFCLALAGCEGKVSYSADVQPILDSYCVKCHSDAGEGEAASGLAVDSYDAVMKGTKFAARLSCPAAACRVRSTSLSRARPTRRFTCRRITTNHWPKAEGSRCRGPISRR